MTTALKQIQATAHGMASGQTWPSGPGVKAPFELQLGPLDTPSVISGTAFRLVPTTAASAKDAALDIAYTQRPLLGLGTQDVFTVAGSNVTATGMTTVRLAQIHAGVPVEGGALTLVLDQNLTAVHLRNTTLPDITRSPAVVLGAQAGTAIILARHPLATDLTSALYYRRSGRYCDTADLGWRFSFFTAQGRRTAWIDAHGGTILADHLHVDDDANVGVYRQTNCPSEQLPTSPERVCAWQGECSPDTPSDAHDVCVWTKDLWSYWADPTHGLAATQGYGNRQECMKANLVCSQEKPQCLEENQYGDYYINVPPGALMKETVAHEWSHALVRWNATVPVYPATTIVEHICDVQAMAIIEPSWKYKRTPAVGGCVLRDWAVPTSVPQIPGIGSPAGCSDMKQVAYPTTFDEYNSHSMDEDDPSIRSYMAYGPHIGSVLWSHMIYALAQKPGMDRKSAAEPVIRALRGELIAVPEDFSFTGYAAALKQQADLDGGPVSTQMRASQEEAKLWQPAEYYLADVYSKPGLVSGYGQTLSVVYDRYIPGVVDEIRVSVRGSQGWTDSSTGISGSTVYSGISAAYDSTTGYYFVAWRSSNGSLRYLRKHYSSGWPSPNQIPNATATHDPTIVAGGGMVRLYYRDSATGQLRYLRWDSSGQVWEAPLAPFNVVPDITGSPSATWDGTTFQISAPDLLRRATIFSNSAAPLYESWSQSTFTDCAYSSAVHAWAGEIAVEATNGRLQLLGSYSQWAQYGLELHQAVATRNRSSWSFLHHGNLERVADGAELEMHLGRLYAVTWKFNYYSSTAVVTWKLP